MAQGKAERCINPSEERFLGSQQRHKREVHFLLLPGDLPEKIGTMARLKVRSAELNL